MSVRRSAPPRLPLAILAAFGLAVVHPKAAAAQQTLTFTLAAVSQSGAATTPYGNVTLQAPAASATVTLTAGNPQIVSLGTLDAGYSAATFPNGTSIPFTFSFMRAFIVTPVGGGPFTFAQPLAGNGFARRGGSVGQYASWNFSLSGGFSSADLGQFGILQAQWQPGSAFNDGLSENPAPLSVLLTFVSAPEPSQTAALTLGILGLAALTFCARRRTRV